MTYISAKAVALSGIKKDMLHYLCRADICAPLSSRKLGERGHGVRKKYTLTDLASFETAKKLCESGESPLELNKAIRELHGKVISSNRYPLLMW